MVSKDKNEIFLVKKAKWRKGIKSFIEKIFELEEWGKTGGLSAEMVVKEVQSFGSFIGIENLRSMI